MNQVSHKSAAEKGVVYYDGSCPMCTAFVGTIDSSAERDTFVLQDITTGALPAGVSRSAVEKEMYVIAEGKTYKNAAAVLKILERYPAWRPFVWFGRLPGIRSVLPIGYNFVAANRHSLFGPLSRVYWLKVVIGLGFLVGILLSLKLWLSTRWYPLTPVADFLPTVLYPYDWGLLFILMGFLVGMLLSSRPRFFIWAAVVTTVSLVLLDQQRLQPWVYQYTLMLAALGLFSWQRADLAAKEAILNTCRFLVASIFIWSGIQKINVGFMGEVFPWMVAPLAELFPSLAHNAFFALGLFVPFLQIAIGVGLLSRRFRVFAIGLALTMCLFVLFVVGMPGHNLNTVVIPWNIAMALMVWILFAYTPSVTARQILWVKDSVFHVLVFFAAGVLPLLYFFNVWDSYPAWSLYSGTTNRAVIYLSETAKTEQPAYIQQFILRNSKDENVLSLSYWALTELNVPHYPETRVFKNVARSICAATKDSSEVTLVMSGRLSWFNRDGRQVFTCRDL